jgi:hypothetical protein
MIDEELVKNGLKTILRGLGEEPQPLQPKLVSGQPAKLLDLQQTLKITFIISLGFGVVFFLVSLMNIIYQNKILFTQQLDKAKEFSESVLTAIRYPMMTGDQPVIQRQFEEFNKLRGMSAMQLIDYKMVIKRSAYKGEINKRVSDVIVLQEKTQNVEQAVNRGNDFIGLEARREAINGSGSVLTIVRPISNEKICASCHGSALKTLGALRIELDWSSTEKAMAAGQQRNISFVLVGMMIMAGLVFTVLSNFTGKK